ncbi:hexitol phosphatase HxpB [bacterium]|nr:hexitol phosphatase HxpB [bacterium]
MLTINGILFDMDGVLIDSEPFWRQAEMELFATVGLTLSEEDCRQTTGLRIEEVVAHWYAIQPWSGTSPSLLSQQILDRVVELVGTQGQPMAGVQEALQACRQAGLPLGLASSSNYCLIEATLERLGLRPFFSVIHSAQDESWGKPHPAVYLSAASKLQVSPLRCLAIEDSLNGVISAKAARMPVLAIPDREQAANPRFCLADCQLSSLLEFPTWLAEQEVVAGLNGCQP